MKMMPTAYPLGKTLGQAEPHGVGCSNNRFAPAARVVPGPYSETANVIESISTPLAHFPDHGSYAFFQPVDLPGIEIMTARNSQRLWRVFHTRYAVCTMFDIGPTVVEWRYRGKRRSTRNSELMLMEPGELHVTLGGSGVTPGSYCVFFLDPRLVGESAVSLGLQLPPHIAVPATARQELFDAFARFYHAQESGTPLLERQSLLIRAVELIFVHCCEQKPRAAARDAAPPALRRARDYLHEHWVDNVSLDELARIASLSRFHFIHAFKREYMLPPHAYQTCLRVEKARQLLRAGIPTSAIEAGFADQSHLIRHFRRVWGITPAQYASAVRGKGRNIVLYENGAPWKNRAAASSASTDGVALHHEVASPVAPPPSVTRTGPAPPARPLPRENPTE